MTNDPEWTQGPKLALAALAKWPAYQPFMHTIAVVPSGDPLAPVRIAFIHGIETDGFNLSVSETQGLVRQLQQVAGVLQPTKNGGKDDSHGHS